MPEELKQFVQMFANDKCYMLLLKMTKMLHAWQKDITKLEEGPTNGKQVQCNQIQGDAHL